MGDNRKLGRILHREAQAPVVGGYYSASTRLTSEYRRFLILQGGKYTSLQIMWNVEPTRSDRTLGRVLLREA